MINKLIKKYEALAAEELRKANDPSIHITLRCGIASPRCKIYNEIVRDLKELRRFNRTKKP